MQRVAGNGTKRVHFIIWESQRRIVIKIEERVNERWDLRKVGSKI